MAEAINSAFVGADYEKLGNALANIILNKLSVFWDGLKKELSSGNVTVEAYHQ